MLERTAVAYYVYWLHLVELQKQWHEHMVLMWWTEQAQAGIAELVYGDAATW